MNDNSENDYSIRNSDNLFGSEALQGLIGQGFNSLAFERNVEEIILDIGNDFLENIINFAIKAAKLRGSETLDQKDIKFSFESLAGIKINSKILDEFKIYKQHIKNPNHVQRMNAINSLK